MRRRRRLRVARLLEQRALPGWRWAVRHCVGQFNETHILRARANSELAFCGESYKAIVGRIAARDKIRQISGIAWPNHPPYSPLLDNIYANTHWIICTDSQDCLSSATSSSVNVRCGQWYASFCFERENFVLILTFSGSDSDGGRCSSNWSSGCGSIWRPQKLYAVMKIRTIVWRTFFHGLWNFALIYWNFLLC